MAASPCPGNHHGQANFKIHMFTWERRHLLINPIRPPCCRSCQAADFLVQGLLALGMSNKGRKRAMKTSQSFISSPFDKAAKTGSLGYVQFVYPLQPFVADMPMMTCNRNKQNSMY